MNKSVGTKAIDRRTVLRGLGTAVALPWLEAMSPSPLSFTRTATASVGPAARRMAFLFIPNGVHAPEWRPTGEGRDYSMSSLLAPLESRRKHINILSGLAHNNARALGDGPGDHARSAACFLTGAHPYKTAGSDIKVGISVDQVAAAQVGEQTRFASLELGCDPGLTSGGCDSGYSCAYSANISWRTDRTPMAKEINPRNLFDRMFMIGSSDETAEARARRLATRKSILDFVSDDRSRLRRELGTNDRHKIDEYFHGVRELEQRIDRIERIEHDPAELAHLERPEGVPGDYREHLRLMMDMMVIAFQLDLTRVTSFMYANEGSNRSFPFLEIPEGHHNLSHHGGDQQKIEKIRRINKFQVESFGYFIDRLASERDEHGSLLDNSMVVFGSAISDGNRHNHEDLPLVLAGRGGGTIRPGRHIVYEKNTPLCNLYVSMLQRMGVRGRSFGDSTGKLHDLA